MTLEELIYNRLIERPTLTEKLTRFKGIPAVFYQSSPGDQAGGWAKDQQYPRIDFVVDLQANAERQTSGLMTLNIWCSESGIQPEEIEPEAQSALRDMFMQPDEQPPYCLRWLRSDSFESKDRTEKGLHVIGITVLLDVLAFPCQETTDPDPIMAMNQFIREWEPKAVIIGVDKLPDYYMAQEEEPAFYFRLVALNLERETNTMAWMDANIAGHIFAPTVDARLQWLKYLVDSLAIQGEVTMLDTSPMFVKNIKADSAADYMVRGQLQLNVRFGILRRPKYAHTLSKTNIPRERLDAEAAKVYVIPKPTAGYAIDYKIAGTDYEE